MSGKRSQRKGRAAEIELTRILNENGIPAQTGSPLNFGKEADVSIPMIHCEVKRNERLNVHNAMRQAENDCKKFADGIPVLFFRRNREPWYCMMSVQDWIPMYNSWIDKKNGE